MPNKALPIWHACAYTLGNNMSPVHMFREFVFTLYQATLTPEMCKKVLLGKLGPMVIKLSQPLHFLPITCF